MRLRWYVLRRLAWTAFAVYLVLTVTFGLLAVSPNAGEMQAAFAAAAHGGNPDAAMAAYRARAGATGPLFARYVDYLAHAVILDWGWSTTRSQPVVTAVGNAWPYTVQYVLPAVLLAVLVGYGAGFYTALRRGTATDHLGSALAFFGVSVPNFWLAVVCILVFGVWTRSASAFGLSLGGFALPTYYDASVPLLSVANLRQLILPVFVVSTSAVATQLRYARSQALDYLDADFVKVARAKGASDGYVLVHHVLRVAAVPLVTVSVVEFLTVLFAGVFVVEYVFQIPGIGLLAFKAIRGGDTALVLATTLIPAFLAILGNLAQDLAYAVLDPRVGLGGER